MKKERKKPNTDWHYKVWSNQQETTIITRIYNPSRRENRQHKNLENNKQMVPIAIYWEWLLWINNKEEYNNVSNQTNPRISSKHPKTSPM